MLAEVEKERQMEDLQEKRSHAEGTSVKCEALCRWHTTIMSWLQRRGLHTNMLCINVKIPV